MRSVLFGFVLVVGALGTSVAVAGPIVIGSKNFGESRLLAEIFAQTLESNGFEVERRFDLAGTAVVFRALRSGDVHVYPEYTGTGWITLLGRDIGGSAAEVLAGVRREFRERHDLVWLAPLGFENAYEVAVRREVAERRNLRTIADLARDDEGLRYAFGFEFQEREDGLVGLRRAYGLDPENVVSMQQTLKYAAAGDGEIDVLDVYTTDGLVLVHDLVLLEDPAGVFPPYQAAPLAHGPTLRDNPAMATALARLSGTLDHERMRGLNKRAEVDGEPIERIAADFLEELGVLESDRAARTRARAGEGGRDRNVIEVLADDPAALGQRTVEHLVLVFGALTLSILVAVPLGLALERRASSAETVIRGIGVLQTIPSIALLAFMIPLLGVGAKPAIAALFLYGLYPIVRNTFTGVRDADPNASLSALALGMTPRQVLVQVKLPLAVPVILAGVRTAAVISVGTATLAAFIGAGGLGEPIVAGLQLDDTGIILSGAMPAAVLALAVDALLALAERALRPRL